MIVVDMVQVRRMSVVEMVIWTSSSHSVASVDPAQVG